MATSAANQLGIQGQGDGGFFSRIEDFLGNVNNVTSQAKGIYNNVSPIWTPSVVGHVPNNPQPTYQGPNNTTGTAVPAMGIDPKLLMIGAAILAAILILK